jgi:hypothetical protein
LSTRAVDAASIVQPREAARMQIFCLFLRRAAEAVGFICESLRASGQLTGITDL